MKRKPRLMKQIFAGMYGNGAHCGLTDRYSSQEAALVAALAAHEPFDTGWYSSKKEIASARIYSEDGAEIKVEVSVSDDFDTEGLGYVTVTDWSIKAVDSAIGAAWSQADQNQADNAPYIGFSICKGGRCDDYYLLSNGEYDTPPGDHYHWWGWQHDYKVDSDGVEVGIPNPGMPLPVVAAFENWARRHYEQTEEVLTIGEWSIKPWGRS